MSQLKGKQPLFVKCERCSVIIPKSFTNNHSNDCPPDLQKVSYGFIKDQVLYGKLDIKTNEDIKSLSSKDKENLVFLSQNVIQLCGFSIGDYVVLNGVNDVQPIAKRIWPTVEKSLTSIMVTKACLDLNGGEIGKSVTVSKLPDNCDTATQIILILLNAPKPLDITSELYTRISKTFSGHYITTGNIINVWFYGRNLRFEVKSVETGKTGTETNFENNFSRLTVEEVINFYAVNETTKWSIYRDQDSYTKETTREHQYVVAGLQEESNEIQEVMHAALGKSNNVNSLNSCRSVLLYGHSGTGKTTLAYSLAQESKANTVKICAADLYSKYSSSVENAVRELFQSAIDQSPSVIVLDEVDILCPSRNSRLTDTEKRIVSTIIVMLDNVNQLPDCKIFIIATTNKIDNIDPGLRRCGRLDREIEIPTPNPNARMAIIKKLLVNSKNSFLEEDIKEVGLNTHGFVGADLVSLCSQAELNAAKRDGIIILEDFKLALRKVRPSAMREVQIEVPNVKWNDIGGQENLKLILRQAVEWPLKYADSFLRLGVTPPRGVLMFGPPGCSKTMIAKALATESGLNFLSIKGPELFSKWVGESEKAIREVFRKARQVAPSIVFFDEIDALGSERSSGSSTSVQERVLAQLLTELDGVTPLGDVTILAATNRPDKIDKALLRPGRLDRIVYVPLPDQNTRREIFRIKFNKMPTKDVCIDDLIKKTEGYSGAEINAVCQEAAMMALEESLEIDVIESRHFEKALKLITPRTPQSLIILYEDYVNIKL